MGSYTEKRQSALIGRSKVYFLFGWSLGFVEVGPFGDCKRGALRRDS